MNISSREKKKKGRFVVNRDNLVFPLINYLDSTSGVENTKEESYRIWVNLDIRYEYSWLDF